MTKAIALQLLTGTTRDFRSHLLPAVSIYLPQLLVKLPLTLSLLSPPFVVGDPASIAQQIGIPILASTDAPITSLDGTDVALHLIVGAWKLGHIVAVDQVRSQVREHLQEMREAVLLIVMEHAALRQCLQFPIPGIEALPDLLVGDLFFSLGPTAVQDMLSCQNPRAHPLHLFTAAPFS